MQYLPKNEMSFSRKEPVSIVNKPDIWHAIALARRTSTIIGGIRKEVTTTRRNGPQRTLMLTFEH
jgi:hypothetical protein